MYIHGVKGDSVTCVTLADGHSTFFFKITSTDVHHICALL